MAYETILFEVADHVATITINRPQAMNTITRTMINEFAAAWTAIAADDDIHAVVLRAAPGRAFCTGADVRAGPEDTARGERNWHGTDPAEKLGPKSQNCWKPVIVAVHGMAAAGAFYWLNEADIIVASE